MSEAKIPVLITIDFPQELLERIRAVSPRLELHVHPTRSPEEVPDKVLADAEILYTARMLPDVEDVPELRWIQFHFAGIDHAADHPLLRDERVRVSTLSGAAAPQMAEFALMSILALGHKLLPMVEDKEQRAWAEDRFTRFEPRLLRGATVGIVGYGSIGREIGRLCSEFGAQVLAVKKDLMNLAKEMYLREGIGDPNAELADRLYPPQALGSMVALCDFVVVTVPLTSDTRGMINAQILGKMRSSAYLVDISRGGVVDHGSLIEALQEKRIAGAALDVYPVEPLPQSSPLWTMSNVILSPHIAGNAPGYQEHAVELFTHNLRRYLSEQPLLNLYVPERGY